MVRRAGAGLPRAAGGAAPARWLPLALAGLLLLPLSGAAGTEAPAFGPWLDGVRREAAARGISRATLEAALARLAPLPRVLALDRRQPETTLSVEQYVARSVTPARVREGRTHLVTHRALLEEIGSRYGVAPPIVVALWGLETSYGRDLGRFPVLAALATLAHDGRRSAVFREELLAALSMLEEGQVTLARLRGSWAGAMGQSQFLPTSFRRYAVDHDGDGRADIWRSLPDVFASIANYLAQAGWRRDQTWGHRVRLPAGFDRDLADLAVERSPARWEALGVRRADGGGLPDGEGEMGSIVLPDGLEGAAYLVYPNFRALLRWNRSLRFAAAAGHLADRLAAVASPPEVRGDRDQAG